MIKCKCCKKILRNSMGNAKFCSSCNLYLYKLKGQLSYYKNKSNRLTIQIYGQKSGSERVRLGGKNAKLG